MWNFFLLYFPLARIFLSGGPLKLLLLLPLLLLSPLQKNFSQKCSRMRRKRQPNSQRRCRPYKKSKVDRAHRMGATEIPIWLSSSQAIRVEFCCSQQSDQIGPSIAVWATFWNSLAILFLAKRSKKYLVTFWPMSWMNSNYDQVNPFIWSCKFVNRISWLWIKISITSLYLTGTRTQAYEPIRGFQINQSVSYLFTTEGSLLSKWISG